MKEHPLRSARTVLMIKPVTKFQLSLWIFGLTASIVSAADEPQNEAIGRVAFTTGSVFINGKRAIADQPLAPKAKVETEAGEVVLIIGKDTLIQLGRHSVIGLPSAEEALIAKGNLRSAIRSPDTKPVDKDKFLFRTRAAVLGVRGTEIGVSVPHDKSEEERFMVFRGKAEVRAETLAPAQSTSSQTPPKAAPPSPRVILQAGELLSITALKTPPPSGLPSGAKQQETLPQFANERVTVKMAIEPQALRSSFDQNFDKKTDQLFPKSPRQGFQRPGVPEDEEGDFQKRLPQLPQTFRDPVLNGGGASLSVKSNVSYKATSL